MQVFVVSRFWYILNFANSPCNTSTIIKTRFNCMIKCPDVPMIWDACTRFYARKKLMQRVLEEDDYEVRPRFRTRRGSGLQRRQDRRTGGAQGRRVEPKPTSCTAWKMETMRCRLAWSSLDGFYTCSPTEYVLSKTVCACKTALNEHVNDDERRAAGHDAAGCSHCCPT